MRDPSLMLPTDKANNGLEIMPGSPIASGYYIAVQLKRPPFYIVDGHINRFRE